MSYAKKAKGWRNVTVNNQLFRWCFVAGGEDSLLKLQGTLSSGRQAIFTMRNWRDPWLSLGQVHSSPNERGAATSKLAAAAVVFALKNGWLPDEPGEAIYFEYKNESFVVP